MGYVLALTFVAALGIYVVMHLWWLALAGGLAWGARRLVRQQLAARHNLRVAAADEVADLRQRADEGHAAYMRGEPTF